MIGLVVLVFITIISLGIVYKVNTSPVDSSDKTEIEVIIPEGSTIKDIGKILEEKDLIRSSNFFGIYCKLFHVGNLKATKYKLNKSMDLQEIIEILEKGNSLNKDQITIKFEEGINIKRLATIISNNTNNEYDDVIELANDKKYIKELEEKYWFISDDINNDDLYFKLEGYLFPDTYFFASKDVSVKEIFGKMLDQTDKVLSKYKKDMQEKKLSVHFVLTMASIIEKEGKAKDFKDISSVFYNRIDKNMKFESCASAIYGKGLEFDQINNRVIDDTIMKDNNPYNTYIVGVPIGPICLPSEKAIEAAINPSDSDFLFFLSDNTGKTYFFENYQLHQKKKNELINAGKWN